MKKKTVGGSGESDRFSERHVFLGILRVAEMLTRGLSRDITRLLARLEERGFINRRREGGDRRAVRAHITEQGLELLKAVDKLVRDLHGRHLGHFGERELGTFDTPLKARLLNPPENDAFRHAKTSGYRPPLFLWRPVMISASTASTRTTTVTQAGIVESQPYLTASVLIGADRIYFARVSRTVTGFAIGPAWFRV